MTAPPSGPLAALLRPDLPARFVRSTVTIPAGTSLPYQPESWRDALVLLIAGELAVEECSGLTVTFHRGAWLTLTDMTLRALHSRGPVAVTLVAVRRRPG